MKTFVAEFKCYSSVHWKGEPYFMHNSSVKSSLYLCFNKNRYTNIYFAVNIFTKLKPFAKKFNRWDSFYIEIIWNKCMYIVQYTYTDGEWKTRNKISSKQNKMRKKLNWTLEYKEEKNINWHHTETVRKSSNPLIYSKENFPHNIVL